MPEIKDITFGDLRRLRQKSVRLDATEHIQSNSGHNGHHQAPLTFNAVSKTQKRKPLEVPSTGRMLAPSTLRMRPGQGKIGMDPRFSEVSGNLNDDLFAQSYEFLEDVRDSEKTECKREFAEMASSIKECGDNETVLQMANRRRELRRRLKQMDSEDAQRKKLTAETTLRRSIRKEEADSIVKTGKRDFHVSTANIRGILRSQRLEELQGKPQKLAKFLAKDAKKKAVKNHWMPSTRREIILKP